MIDNGCISYFELLHRVILKTKGTGLAGNKVTDPIAASVEALNDAKRDSKKVIFIGNGGSLAACSHFANDLCLTGVVAMDFCSVINMSCIGNDFGFERVFARQVDWFMKPDDLLIALSCSGSSENVLAAVDVANQKGNPVITFSGFEEQNNLRTLGDINFWVPSKSYGIVQLAHEAILHCIVDTVAGLR